MTRIITGDLGSVPVVSAWGALGLGSPPTSIEVLKDTDTTGIFRLTEVGPSGSSVIGKRRRLDSLLLEKRLYEEVLPKLEVESLEYLGFIEDRDPELGWLFLEDMGSAIRYSTANAEHRRLAGRWLGRMHTLSAGDPGLSDLPDRGPAFYRGSLWGAQNEITNSINRFENEHRALLDSLLGKLATMENHWDEFERACDQLPSSLVHGDFAARNIFIGHGSSRMLVIDWETAGLGSPIADLAQSPEESAAFSASPDLHEYATTIRTRWPQASNDLIGHLADYALMARSLVAIGWFVPFLKDDWARHWMKKLAFYERTMGAAIRTLAWGP